nr:hypothetical protein [Micromonospora sp. DSM 115978]
MTGDGGGTGRLLRGLLAVLVGMAALVGAVRLVAPLTAAPDDEPFGVRRQLAFVRGELDGGAGERAQELFPEGYFFSHALYGLSWVELGLRNPDRRATALEQARWAVRALESPAGSAPFSADLAPAYGVFYSGWLTWLRGGVLSLQPPRGRDRDELRRFEAGAVALGAAFDGAATPFLAAYPGQAWPVDSTVAMASSGFCRRSTGPSRTSSTCGSGTGSWCRRWGWGRRCGSIRWEWTVRATSTPGRCCSG